MAIPQESLIKQYNIANKHIKNYEDHLKELREKDEQISRAIKYLKGEIEKGEEHGEQLKELEQKLEKIWVDMQNTKGEIEKWEKIKVDLAKQ